MTDPFTSRRGQISSIAGTTSFTAQGWPRPANRTRQFVHVLGRRETAPTQGGSERRWSFSTSRHRFGDPSSFVTATVTRIVYAGCGVDGLVGRANSSRGRRTLHTQRHCAGRRAVSPLTAQCLPHPDLLAELSGDHARSDDSWKPAGWRTVSPRGRPDGRCIGQRKSTPTQCGLRESRAKRSSHRGATPNHRRLAGDRGSFSVNLVAVGARAPAIRIEP